MMESSDFAKKLAELVCLAALRAKMEYQYEQLAQHRMDNGKYDRRGIEHISAYQANAQLDGWLQGLLVDAALEKRDKVAFDRLTEPLLEGW